LSIAVIQSAVGRKQRSAGKRDLLDVPVISAAAAAQHRQKWKPVEELRVLCRELLRIAGIEIRRRIELGVAPE
jgi:hypothetical protein